MTFWKKKTKTAQEGNPGRKIPLNKIWTDKFGNGWHEYQNPMTMPARRAIAAEIATRFAEMNLTKDALLKLMAAMKKKANEGNIVDVFHLLGEIEFRLNFIGEEKTLMELAACYYVLDNEDETQFDEAFRAKKIEIMTQDEETQGFFLEKAFQHTKQFSDISGTGISDYLKQMEPNTERLNQILQTLKLENTLMK